MGCKDGRWEGSLPFCSNTSTRQQFDGKVQMINRINLTVFAQLQQIGSNLVCNVWRGINWVYQYSHLIFSAFWIWKRGFSKCQCPSTQILLTKLCPKRCCVDILLKCKVLNVRCNSGRVSIRFKFVNSDESYLPELIFNFLGKLIKPRIQLELTQPYFQPNIYRALHTA